MANELRRVDTWRMIPTERLVLHAIMEVEMLGKHPLLADAVAHLAAAKVALSDYADHVVATQTQDRKIG